MLHWVDRFIRLLYFSTSLDTLPVDDVSISATNGPRVQIRPVCCLRSRYELGTDDCRMALGMRRGTCATMWGLKIYVR
jgi:hypothetical protein